MPKQSWRDFFQPLFIVGRLAEGGGDGDATHKVDPTRLAVASASTKSEKLCLLHWLQPLARNSKIGNDDSSSFQKQPLCWRPKSKVWRSHFIWLLWWFLQSPSCFCQVGLKRPTHSAVIRQVLTSFLVRRFWWYRREIRLNKSCLWHHSKIRGNRFPLWMTNQTRWGDSDIFQFILTPFIINLLGLD